MASRKDHSFQSYLACGIIGILSGICLSMAAASVLYAIFRQPAEKDVVVPTLLSTPTPNSQHKNLLDQAEMELAAGRPENVKGILLPQLKDWESPVDLAEAYELLGEAELQQYHYQLAAGFFEKLYIYDPSAENLYRLAEAYDIGGDLERAQEKYQALVDMEDPQASEYRFFAQSRLVEIDDILKHRKATNPPP